VTYLCNYFYIHIYKRTSNKVLHADKVANKANSNKRNSNLTGLRTACCSTLFLEACLSVIQTNLQTHAAYIQVMKLVTLPSKFNCQFTLSVFILPLQLLFCCQCSSVFFYSSYSHLLFSYQLIVFSFIVLYVSLDWQCWWSSHISASIA